MPTIRKDTFHPFFVISHTLTKERWNNYDNKRTVDFIPLAAYSATALFISYDPRSGIVHQIGSRQQCDIIAAAVVFNGRRVGADASTERGWLYHCHELRSGGPADSCSKKEVQSHTAVSIDSRLPFRMAYRHQLPSHRMARLLWHGVADIRPVCSTFKSPFFGVFEGALLLNR